MRFKPGKSGNPGGIPKGLYDFKRKVRACSDKALRTLFDALESKSANIRIKAANAIIEHAWGKAGQFIFLSDSNPEGSGAKPLTREEKLKLMLERAPGANVTYELPSDVFITPNPETTPQSQDLGSRE